MLAALLTSGLEVSSLEDVCLLPPHCTEFYVRLSVLAAWMLYSSHVLKKTHMP